MQEELGKERWISYRMEFLYGFLLNQEHPDIFCALVWQLNQFAWTFLEFLVKNNNNNNKNSKACCDHDYLY